MVYGRYGDIENPSFLDTYMNQNNTDLRFKIDNIIINKNSYRNYSLYDNLNNFELVRELTDEEFYPMQLLICSNYKFPHCIIDIEKVKNNVTELVNLLRNKKEELGNLEKEIGTLEKSLYKAMKQK